ncbi:MAG: hypothetical protein LBT14_13750, partial [Treponema sp.]|nr:hypothetical protein [Treponema sp.]
MMNQVLKTVFLAVCFACMGHYAEAGGGKEQDRSLDAEISARAAVGRMEAALEEPFFEGDGGKALRLAVLTPVSEGGAENAWLPVYVQGMLNNNLKKYSAMTLIDRQSLNQVLTEQGLSL